MKKLPLFLVSTAIAPSAFAQSYNDAVNPWFLLMAYAAMFLVGILVTRAVFSIPRIVRHQKAQTALLLQIAINTLPQKDALSARELNKIIDGAGVGDDVPRIDTQAPEWK